MNKNLISRYLWIVEVIMKYRRLNRKQINELWKVSKFSDGNDLPERTFHHYRRGIEDTFNIDIACDEEGCYHIESEDSPEVRQFANWILNSNATTTAIQELGSGSGRVEMEDVPSARDFLPVVSEAMRDNHKVVFTYAGFTKSRPEVGILFSPYLLKIYKQRWYMFGEKDGGGLRTYALDRVTEMDLTTIDFKLPVNMDMSEYFGNVIGVTTSKAAIRDVIIRATLTRAKYLRALPLHHTQEEEIHDFYSVFRYKLKLNYELVSELMSMGPDVVVIAPRELQVMITERLRDTLNNYRQM